MRKLFDQATQTEIEVPDEAEIAALKAKAQEAEEWSKKYKEQEEILKDPDLGNFKAMRGKLKAAEKEAADKAAEVENIKKAMSVEQPKPADQVVTPPQPQDVNEIVKRSLAEERINQKMGRYTDQNQRQTVKHYFDKLVTKDELLDDAMVEKRLQEAERLAIPEGRVQRASGIAGGGAMYGQPPAAGGEGNHETLDRGKELLSEVGYTYKSDKFKTK